jgi:hypothetical protein
MALSSYHVSDSQSVNLKVIRMGRGGMHAHAYDTIIIQKYFFIYKIRKSDQAQLKIVQASLET